MFEEENDNRIYNLIISNGTDKENEYKEFLERIYSATDFLWKESISSSYATAGDEFFEKIDAIIILSGMYKDNKEKFDQLIDAGKKYNIPIILVKPYGLEEIPEKLDEIATSYIGWNKHCIVDAIKTAVNDSSYSCNE